MYSLNHNLTLGHIIEYIIFMKLFASENKKPLL